MAAASANAEVDLRPLGRAAAVVACVVATIVLIALLVPSGGAFGGPLQANRLEQGSSLTVVRSTKGKRVTFQIPVPWNAGTATAVLDEVVPLEAEGVEIVGTAVVPLGQPAVATDVGFPPPAAVLEPIVDQPVPPGSGTLDGFQVVVGLSGKGGVAAFALVYRVDGTRRVAILPHGVVLCPKACGDGPRADVAERQDSLLHLLSRFVAAPPR